MVEDAIGGEWPMTITLNCPICINPSTEVFLRRSEVPVHQNILASGREAARSMLRGHLELAACFRCGFVYNRAFDPGLLDYGPKYDNCQDYSPFVQQYLDKLADSLLAGLGRGGGRIVEVGCGSGSFLRRLVARSENGVSGVGFDPSYKPSGEPADSRLTFYRRYYDAACSDETADLVVCRHVIEHVPDPVGMLKAIRLALRNSPGAKLFLETPNVEWILENGVFWDFFYEHCSYFSPQSLRMALELAGFNPVQCRAEFGGQYLWMTATPNAQDAPPKPHGAGAAIVQKAVGYGRRDDQICQGHIRHIKQLRQDGGVAIWGAGAKGVTFAHLVDPYCKLIEAVVDLNPNKQGRFLPGSGHPIVAPVQLKNLPVRVAILMNPNYREENSRLTRALNLDILLKEL